MQTKERGQAHIPDPELFSVVCLILIEGFSSEYFGV